MIASEEAPWSVALAAPVAARMHQTGASPLFMAVTNPPTREAEWLLTLSPTRRPIVLVTSNQLKLGPVLEKRSPELLKIGSDPCQASAMLATHFWSHSRSVVVAAADDPEAVILGSALAAGLRVPLLLCEKDRAGSGIEESLKELGVTRMLVATSEANDAPRWIEQADIAVEVLPPHSLQHRLCETLGRKKIHGVVVAAPDSRADVGGTAWLAPYVSFSRGVPLVLARAQAAAVAEAEVRQLVERESLGLHTVTVLADYSSIGFRNTEVDPNGSEEEATTTPPTPPSMIGGQRPEVGGQMPATPAALSATGGTAAATSGGTAATPPPPPPHYTVRTVPFIKI